MAINVTYCEISLNVVGGPVNDWCIMVRENNYTNDKLLCFRSVTNVTMLW